MKMWPWKGIDVSWHQMKAHMWLLIDVPHAIVTSLLALHNSLLVTKLAKFASLANRQNSRWPIYLCTTLKDPLTQLQFGTISFQIAEALQEECFSCCWPYHRWCRSGASWCHPRYNLYFPHPGACCEPVWGGGDQRWKGSSILRIGHTTTITNSNDGRLMTLIAHHV